jgi:hypothetical protein
MRHSRGVRSLAAVVGAVAAAGARGQAPTQILPLESTTPRIGGNFGWSVSSVPDVSGDGRVDLIVGASAESTAQCATAGRVRIYSGFDGQLLRTINPPTIQPIGNFGWAVAGMPDVNGDGRGEVLIGGIFEAKNNGVLSGRAYMYSGGSGQLLRAWVSPMNEDFGSFGASIAWVPDVDGDGFPDVIVGAPNESWGGRPGVGRVYLYSGGTGVYLRTLLSPIRETGAQFGAAVAGIADLDGDGRGDIIVGAPYENPAAGPPDCGRVYAFSGRTGTLLRVWGSPLARRDGHFGAAVAAIGDVNGDGLPDVAIGAPYEMASGQDHAGRVYIFSGAGPGLRWLWSPSAQTEGNFGASLAGGVTPGGAPAPIVIVGAPEEDLPTNGGRVYIYNLPLNTCRPLASPAGQYKGKFGASVSGCADTDWSWRSGVLVGGYFEGGFGRAYLGR